MESFFDDSDGDDGDFVRNTPPVSTASSNPVVFVVPNPPLVSTPSPPLPTVVPETLEHIWSTPEYEKRKRRRAERRLFVRDDYFVQVPFKVDPQDVDDLDHHCVLEDSKFPPDSYVPDSQETRLPPDYVPGVGHEMLKLLVPCYFGK